jgi:hypothetical protein
VTEVTVSGPLSVANGTTTPLITFTGSQGHAIYGDGSDGAGTISGTTTPTRDTFYTTLVVQNGGTLNTANARIFARTSIVVQSGGAIRNDGGAGAAAGTAGAAVASITLNKTAGTGGAGGTAGGSNGTNVTVSLGGAGGNGGTGSGGAGGTAGTATAPIPGRGSPRWLAGAWSSQAGAGGFTDCFCGGAGGGGGGGDGTAGGGGGAGAGTMLLCSPSMDFQTGSVVSCAGGAGGTPAAGNRGGGGGGGGGLVILIYESLTETVAVSVAGGAKGLKTGTGTDGVDGAVGTVVRLKNSSG